MAAAQTACPGIDTIQLETHYRQRLDSTPLDPAQRLPVREWRIGLWAEALNQHSADAASHATYLHDLFYRFRLTELGLFPGTAPLLTELRIQYRLIIITNGVAAIQRPKIAACGVEDLVDDIIVSGEFGVDKPDPSIFRHACERASCQPSQALHVGDSLTSDIAGGLAAGLAATVWVNATAPNPDHSPIPTYRIRQFTDLPTVLKQLTR